MFSSIRGQYETHGASGYYQQHGADYSNPHEPIIRQIMTQIVPDWSLDCTSVLDLACGSGEITMILRGLGHSNIHGIDPYTYAAYEARTGQPAEQYTFEDIAQGALEDRNYSLIACSFALHLVDVSWLPALLFQLQSIAPMLLILTPHKRPQIKPAWGWALQHEILIERVRARLYIATR